VRVPVVVPLIVIVCVVFDDPCELSAGDGDLQPAADLFGVE
jgi:hypothetical protein